MAIGNDARINNFMNHLIILTNNKAIRWNGGDDGVFLTFHKNIKIKDKYYRISGHIYVDSVTRDLVGSFEIRDANKNPKDETKIIVNYEKTPITYKVSCPVSKHSILSMLYNVAYESFYEDKTNEDNKFLDTVESTIMDDQVEFIENSPYY